MVKRHLPSVHVYADDTQLYLAFKPDCALSTNEAISAMEACVREIRVWVLCDKLKINDDKTEVIIIGTRQQLARVQVDRLTVGDARVPFGSAVKNLGTRIAQTSTTASPSFEMVHEPGVGAHRQWLCAATYSRWAMKHGVILGAHPALVEGMEGF